MQRISDSIRRQLGLAGDRPYFEGFDPEDFPVPAFVVDRAALQYNLDILASVAHQGGGHVLAALKAFSLPALLGQISASLDGATASGLYEARLAREQGFSSVHVFGPAYTDNELAGLLDTADHIIFNSPAQWRRVRSVCLRARDSQVGSRQRAGRPDLSFGIRINPEHSEGHVLLYDPCAPKSRMGTTRAVWDATALEAARAGEADFLDGISGIHFHNLCEQGAEPLERTLMAIEEHWDDILSRPEISWLNMGGGHHVTKPDYNRALLVSLMQRARTRWNVEVMIEPGEAVAIHSGILSSRILDIHENGCPIAILDVSATCHMPDTIEMPYTPAVWDAQTLFGRDEIDQTCPGDAIRLAGRTCLSGDVIGEYRFSSRPARGDVIILDDMAHYTTVKTTGFNGMPHPALVVWDSRTQSGTTVREFGYQDFISRLS